MRWVERKRYTDVLAAARAKSPHQILGVEPGCGLEAVRKVYLRMVKTYHPDASDPFTRAFDEEMLKIINGAYEAVVKAEE